MNTLIKQDNININYTLGDKLAKIFEVSHFADHLNSFGDYKLDDLARLHNVMNIYLYDHPALKDVSNSYFTDGINVFIDADFWAEFKLQEKEISNENNNRVQQDGCFYILLQAMHSNLSKLDSFSILEKNYISRSGTKKNDWQIQLPEELKLLFKKWDENENNYFSKPVRIDFSKTVNILNKNDISISLNELGLDSQSSQEDIAQVFKNTSAIYQYMVKNDIYSFEGNEQQTATYLNEWNLLNEPNVRVKDTLLIDEYIEKMTQGIISEEVHSQYIVPLFKIKNDDHGLNFDSFNCVYLFKKSIDKIEQIQDNKEIFNIFCQNLGEAMSNIGSRKLYLINPLIKYKPTDFKRNILKAMAKCSSWHDDLQKTVIDSFVYKSGWFPGLRIGNEYLTSTSTPSDINMERYQAIHQLIHDYDNAISEKMILSSKIKQFRDNDNPIELKENKKTKI